MRISYKLFRNLEIINLESLVNRIVLTVDRPQRWLKPEVCGKIRTGRPRQVAPTHLPAVSLCDKGGVLGGSGICRILPRDAIRKCGEIRDLPTRPRFWPSATCGCVGKKRDVLGGSRFSPHFRKARPCIACSSNNGGTRDNIQAPLKRQRAIAGKPSNDPSLSSPHVESATTVSLRESYRNVQEPSRAMIRNADVRPQFPSK